MGLLSLLPDAPNRTAPKHGPSPKATFELAEQMLGSSAPPSAQFPVTPHRCWSPRHSPVHLLNANLHFRFCFSGKTELICWGCHNKVPLAGFNNGNLLPHSSGGRKSELKVSTVSVSSEGCEGFSPWLVDGHLLLISLHVIFSLCVSLCKCPLFIKTPVLLD